MSHEEHSQNEPEYQFNDEDDAVYAHDDEQPAGEAKAEKLDEAHSANPEGRLPSLQSVPQRKLIISLVALVIFSVIVYKIISIVHVTANKKSQRNGMLSTKVPPRPLPSLEAISPPIQKRPALIPAAPLKSQPAMIASAMPPVTVSNVAPVVVAEPVAAAVDAKILSIQQADERLGETLRESQAETQMRLVTLEQKMAGLNSSLDQLQGSISDIASQVKENKALQTALLAAEKKQRATKNKQTRQARQYYVQAVIPGRAWLHGADGSMLTVTVGDEVPGYGRVSKIDAYSGAVDTTSGLEIHYGVNV